MTLLPYSLNKTKLKQYQSFLEHEVEIRSMLIGHMLGDGHAERRLKGVKHQNTRINLQFGEINLDYATHIHSVFSQKGYCNPQGLVIKTIFDQRTNKNYFYVKFKTYQLKSLNELHTLFYRTPTEQETITYFNKTRKTLRFVKIVPQNIAEFLTPQALAIWIMDDGDFTKKSGTLRIATLGFTLEDDILLQKALLTNFNINTTLHQEREDQYRMYFPKTEVQKIIPLIKPYFVPSMLYKLGLDKAS